MARLGPPGGPAIFTSDLRRNAPAFVPQAIHEPNVVHEPKAERTLSLLTPRTHAIQPGTSNEDAWHYISAILRDKFGDEPYCTSHISDTAPCVERYCGRQSHGTHRSLRVFVMSNARILHLEFVNAGGVWHSEPRPTVYSDPCEQGERVKRRMKALDEVANKFDAMFMAVLDPALASFPVVVVDIVVGYVRCARPPRPKK